MPIEAIDNTKTTECPDADSHNVSRGSGRREVVYRDAAGKTFDAIVVGPGSVSGLLLQITSYPKGSDRVDNVPVATTLKDTGAYFNRLP